MSKERLEEIKLKFNNTIDTMLYVPYEDVKFLIEQADRGVEYDRYLISLEDNKHYVTGLEQQNKRHREAFNSIMTLWKYSEDRTDFEWLAHKMSEEARKELEGEE